MATYTSTQAGNWSDNATWWGGAGHPSANDDNATIGHEVTYDMSDSALTWAAIVINSGGVLLFPVAANSTLLFSTTGTLTVNSGGELRAGTSGAPIQAAYHCYFHWPQGAAARTVFIVSNGGIINIYGDSAYFGDSRYAALDSDWIPGNTLYVTGDYSSKWSAGLLLCVHENIQYDNYVNDTKTFTIVSVGAYDSANDRTPIEIFENSPPNTFFAQSEGYGSKIVCISRNIYMGDPAAGMQINDYSSYTERLRSSISQSAANALINCSNVMFAGWDRAITGENFIGANIVFINNNTALYLSVNFVISADFVSNYHGINGSNYIYAKSLMGAITGQFLANNYAIYIENNITINGDIISSNYGLNNCANIKINGNLISNNYACYTCSHISICGDIKLNTYGMQYDSFDKVQGDFSSNIFDMSYSIVMCRDGTCDIFTVIYLHDNIKSIIICENVDIAGIVRPYRAYMNAGTLLPLTSADGDWQAPDSANDWILQCTPNSYCSTATNMQVVLSPVDDLSYFAKAGTHTLKIKIYPVGWTTPLDQDDIYIIASYLAGSGPERTTVQTSGQTYNNDAWRECSVTFTAAQDGIVYFNLYCSAYEAACYILIDPQWIVSSHVSTLDVLSIHGIPSRFNNGLPATTGISIESKVYATLVAAAGVTGRVDDRIYPQHRPQDIDEPSLVYFRIAGQRDNTLDGYSNLENPRISIECYATAVDARRELADAVIEAMGASTRFSAISAISPVDFYDPGLGEYKRILDFSIWNHDT